MNRIKSVLRYIGLMLLTIVLASWAITYVLNLSEEKTEIPREIHEVLIEKPQESRVFIAETLAGSSEDPMLSQQEILSIQKEAYLLATAGIGAVSTKEYTELKAQLAAETDREEKKELQGKLRKAVEEYNKKVLEYRTEYNKKGAETCARLDVSEVDQAVFCPQVFAKLPPVSILKM